ncbi:hypothetical protein ACLOJK_005509 [Asimina triloba]
MLFERYWPTTTITKEANFNRKSDIQPELHENGMLKGSHFDKNSAQYTNSVKEALRMTMLNQEAIFRNQVNELHHLYKVQQNLMNELNWKEFVNFTTWVEDPKPGPMTYLKEMQSRRSAEENNFHASRASMTVSTQSEKEVSRGHESFYSNLQKPQKKSLDLHLPADEFISTELVKRAKPHTSINGFLETKDFLNGKVDEPKDLKFDLCSGKETTNKGGFGKMLSYRDIHIIDLEESTERSAGAAKAVSSTNCGSASAHAGTQHEHDSQVSVISELNYSERTRKDIMYKPVLKHSSEDERGNKREQKSFDLNAGWNEDDDGSVSDLCAREQSASNEATETHQNQVQVDGSNCRPRTNGCSNDASHQDNAAYSTSTNSTDKSPDLLSHASQLSSYGNTRVSHQSTKFAGNALIHNLNEVVPIDLELIPEACPKLHNNSKRESSCDNGSSSLPLTSFCKKSDETTNLSQEEPTGFLQDDGRRNASGKVEERCSRFSIGNTDVLHTIGNADSRQVNSEKSEEDTLSSRQPRCHVASWGSISSTNDEKASTIDEKTMGSCNPCNTKDLESVSENQQKERFSNLSAHEDSETTQLESDITGTSSNKQVAFTESGVDACLSGKSPELKIQEHNRPLQQQEQAEIDAAMQRAARSLILISSVKTSSTDCALSSRQEVPETVERHDEPQYSSDSYESITLMLTESCVDEYSTTAKPFEERDLGDNASGLNLKRGRRMKDFQRDILPSLVSLSRHEICEDMNIIGAVIKANEYIKNGCRRARTETWCLPTRGRRARLYCSSRRY